MVGVVEEDTGAFGLPAFEPVFEEVEFVACVDFLAFFVGPEPGVDVRGKATCSVGLQVLFAEFHLGLGFARVPVEAVAELGCFCVGAEGLVIGGLGSFG